MHWSRSGPTFLRRQRLFPKRRDYRAYGPRRYDERGSVPAYIQHVVIITASPGDIVTIDNLAAPRAETTAHVLEDAG